MRLIKSTLLALLVMGFHSVSLPADEKGQMEKKTDFNVGIFGEYTKLKPHKEFQGNLDSTKMYTTFTGVNLDYKIFEAITLQAKLGNLTSRIIFSQDGVVEKQNTPIQFGYQIGAKFRIYQNSQIAVFVEPSIMLSQFKTVLHSWDREGDIKAETANSVKNNLKLWSTRLIVERKLDSCTPYVGIQFKKFNIKNIENLTTLFIDQMTNEIVDEVKSMRRDSIRVNNKNLGLVCGLSHDLSKRSTLKLEGRFVNERAICAELSLKF